MTPVSLPLKQSADVLLSLLVMELSHHHLGRRNGVTAAALAQKLGIGERMLRTLVSRAREDGIAIVGTPESGYFIAQTDKELEECCAFLVDRAMHSLMIAARLRKIALPELLGQLHLKT